MVENYLISDVLIHSKTGVYKEENTTFVNTLICFVWDGGGAGGGEAGHGGRGTHGGHGSGSGGGESYDQGVQVRAGGANRGRE